MHVSEPPRLGKGDLAHAGAKGAGGRPTHTSIQAPSASSLAIGGPVLGVRGSKPSGLHHKYAHLQTASRLRGANPALLKGLCVRLDSRLVPQDAGGPSELGGPAAPPLTSRKITQSPPEKEGSPPPAPEKPARRSSASRCPEDPTGSLWKGPEGCVSRLLPSAGKRPSNRSTVPGVGTPPPCESRFCCLNKPGSI